MKKVIILFLCVMSTTRILLGCDHKPLPKELSLPLVNAFGEFYFVGDPVAEQYNKQFDDYKPLDVHEFLKKRKDYEGSFQLHHYSAAAHKQDKKQLDSKEAALLNFVYKMIDHEKEWKSWHTSLQPRGTLKFHSLKYPMIVKDSEIKQEIDIRLDINSPYFKSVLITDDCFRGRAETVQVHFYENQFFHDELQFLQTQQHKMELYWDILPEDEKKCCQESYNKVYMLIVQEIINFKKDENRKAFTRSCMQRNNFNLIQECREAYDLDDLSRKSFLERLKINFFSWWVVKKLGRFLRFN